MIADDSRMHYWKYYISLEKQVKDLEEFIEFDLTINGKVYSFRLLQLLQSICSEIDVVGKVLAKECDSSVSFNRYSNINSWWFVLHNYYETIQIETVEFGKDHIRPWCNFFVVKKNNRIVNDPSRNNSNVPDWWTAYNNVKHRRTELNNHGHLNYEYANLTNVITALAGLFILETLLLEKVGGKVDESVLFSFYGHNVFRNYMTWGAK